MSDRAAVNSDLLELAPPAVRVLEIGCGDGGFAAAYRARYPNSVYIAVERDAAAAAQAAALVDRVIVGDFETLEEAEISGDAPFDLVVMGNVLEALRDGDAALAKVGRLLAPRGHLALCVSNATHWTRLFHLVNGNWPIEDFGAFDRAQLRFFTGESIVAALRANGFRSLKQRPRKSLIDKSRAESWIAALGDTAERLGVDKAAFLERSSTLHYVLVAEKADAPATPSMQIVSAVMAPKLMDVRTTLPAQHMRALPDVHVRYQEKSVALPPVGEGMAKIMLIQRPAPPNDEVWKQWIGGVLQKGWLVVTEYDDHPELVARVLNWPAERKRWGQIAGVHAVQTSTDELAAVFREHNPTVGVFRNAAFTLPPLRDRGSSAPRVFYGAVNRGPASAELARSLAPAIAACPDTHFEVLHDRAFFDALPTERKSFRPLLDYGDYLAAIEASDVALLFLEGTPLELFKSDLKYVECASRGAAVIASPAIYAATIEDGHNGLIAETLKDWAPLLTKLLQDRAFRLELAGNAWADVRDHRMFAGQISARADWYRGLWADRERLHADLLRRCPWLAG